MSLPEQYRPKTLDEVVGNTTTINNLKDILARPKDKIPHSFLFTGDSGCGKTTLARIVAKELGCSERDFREMNSASYRGIDTVREMQEQMRYKPLSGPCRVWLLDEAHKLSTDAQEAMLKALEEPPSWVYFILATTDPQKFKPTMLRRLTQFHVELLTEKRLAWLIKGVAKKEGREDIPEDAIQKMYELSLGSPGLALKVLDKVIGLPPDKMVDALEKNFVSEEKQIIELCRLLINQRPWKEVSAALRELEDEPEKIRRTILGYFAAVLSKQDNASAYLVMEKFKQPLYDIGRPGLVMSLYEAVMEYAK